ncbi:hypothetical protein [Paenibacillus mendelii]|uniref:Uncharacterized protein n=1 Tax=Paenibacillus mendelii TaxID=206163 RepID=A0ABV6J930_9BACL|nr:hypothetical protein [Paenibacillus mendelii]MCQ6561300.1 hypothetical protein [Paenibacillus mendelii]
MKIRYKKALVLSMLTIILMFAVVTPAMAATYAGYNTYGIQLDTHSGTVNDGSIHQWVIAPADRDPSLNSMQFTNSSSVTLNVRIYVGSYTLYSGSLGNGTHPISFDGTAYPGTVYLQITNANFTSAGYSFMYY